MDLDEYNLSYSFLGEGSLEIELYTGDVIMISKIDNHTSKVFFHEIGVERNYTMYDSSKNVVPSFNGNYLISWTESYTLYHLLSGSVPVLNLTQKRELDVTATGCKRIKFNN